MLGSFPNRLDSCTPIGGACKRKPRRISHQAQEGTPTFITQEEIIISENSDPLKTVNSLTFSTTKNLGIHD